MSFEELKFKCEQARENSQQALYNGDVEACNRYLHEFVCLSAEIAEIYAEIARRINLNGFGGNNVLLTN